MPDAEATVKTARKMLKEADDWPDVPEPLRSTARKKSKHMKRTRFYTGTKSARYPCLSLRSVEHARYFILILESDYLDEDMVIFKTNSNEAKNLFQRIIAETDLMVN